MDPSSSLPFLAPAHFSSSSSFFFFFKFGPGHKTNLLTSPLLLLLHQVCVQAVTQQGFSIPIAPTGKGPSLSLLKGLLPRQFVLGVPLTALALISSS